ncbi:MAG: c-type cytochrome domain-containing protein [Bacteroidota bacterium]
MEKNFLDKCGTAATRCGWYALVGAVLLGIWGCNRTDIEPALDYPEDIAPLLRKSCATTGCHNATSARATAGLNLETWDDLFRGSRGGSPIIPYSPDQSYLLFSINTDTSIGPTLTPTMPFNDAPLTAEEYNRIWQWIDDGARNANGEERFPPDPTRRKWYIGHSECDAVAVIDVESRQIMRYIEVGRQPNEIENVLDVRVSPDGKDWFVVFSTYNTHIERYSTLTDEKVADIELGNFGWNRMEFSADGRYAFVVGDYFQEMVVVDLQQNAVVGSRKYFAQETTNPVAHPQRSELYMPQHFASAITVVGYGTDGTLGTTRDVDLVQHLAPAHSGELDPHDIAFLPEQERYFVSCWRSEEIRVFDATTDTLRAAIALPSAPGVITPSPDGQRLFISCTGDLASWNGEPGRMGSIMVLNTGTLEIESVIYSGFQPYGIEVDAGLNALVVANRNVDVNGPRPHHQSTCGERNGYLTLIDLGTLELIDDYKPELLANPICVAIK